MRIVLQPCSSIETVTCVLDNVSHDLASTIPPTTPGSYMAKSTTEFADSQYGGDDQGDLV